MCTWGRAEHCPTCLGGLHTGWEGDLIPACPVPITEVSSAPDPKLHLTLKQQNGHREELGMGKGFVEPNHWKGVWRVPTQSRRIFTPVPVGEHQQGDAPTPRSQGSLVLQGFASLALELLWMEEMDGHTQRTISNTHFLWKTC